MGPEKKQQKPQQQQKPTAPAPVATAPAPVATAPAPVATAPAPAPSKRGRGLTPEARAAAAAGRSLRAAINGWLEYRATPRGPASPKRQERIAAIDAELHRGTRARKVPAFLDGTRNGTQIKDLPLKPAARLALLQEKAALLTERTTRSARGEQLHAAFLAALPQWASRRGATVDQLRAIGVTDDDLRAAGLLS